MTDFAQEGILLQVGMGGCIGLLDAHSLIPRPHVLVAIYMVALASVTNPRLFFDRNRPLSMVELPHAARQAGKAEPGDLLHHRQGLLLDHSGKKGVSSRITFESSGLWRQE